ncbi:MAG: PAS domain S-box protein, partial [Verrucomicrobiota bacterium]
MEEAPVQALEGDGGGGVADEPQQPGFAFLERLDLEEKLEEEKSTVTLLADTRLHELLATVEQLRQSRNAYINLVEDLTQEIEARRQVEAALRSSESKHCKMIANIGDVIVTIDRNGITRYKSANVTKYFGWHPEDLVGVGALEHVHPEDLNSARRFIGSLMEQPNATDTTECRYRCKDGSYKWIEFTGVNLLHDPDIGGILGNYHDITERKLAEQALRASDARYRAVAQSAHDAIITADSAGNIVGWNQGAEHLFGYTEIEASSQPLTMLLPLRYHDGHLAGMARMQAGGQKHIIGKIVEVEGRRKDGSEVPLELSMAEWQVTDGRFYTAIIRDITQRKALEEQFRQSQKLEGIGQLAGGVAHDFNNILAAMMMRLSFLQRNKSLDHESLEIVLELTMDAKRSSSLTRQLLLFSRRSVMEVELLDLNELVANLLKMLGRLLGEHITVQFDHCDHLPPVEADPGMLEQVLMNLAINARDAMPKGGQLTFSIEAIQVKAERIKGNSEVRPGPFICLSVTDTGCGMDEATLKRIFEPFFTTKEVGKGTGLGLATAYGIVAQHKGWVEVESEVG